MRELLLVGAVVIHLPDFFDAAASADEENLGFRDALDASAEAEDDFVGETVGDESGVLVGRPIRDTACPAPAATVDSSRQTASLERPANPAAPARCRRPACWRWAAGRPTAGGSRPAACPAAPADRSWATPCRRCRRPAGRSTRVTLNAVVRRLLSASLAAALKSGTARRIFSTPRPVPVRIQSWPTTAHRMRAAQLREGRWLRIVSFTIQNSPSLVKRHCCAA